MVRREHQPLLEPATLARLLAELRRSPVGPGGHPPTPAVARAVRAAVSAFTELGGRSDLAAKRSEPAMADLGRRSARRGQSPSELRQTFDIVSDRCLRRINELIGPAQPAVSMRALQPRLRTYLPQLRHSVAVGHQQVAALMALSPDRRRAEMLNALFRAAVVPATLLDLAGIDIASPFAPVAWVDHYPPVPLLDELHALVGDDPALVLIPADVLPTLTNHLTASAESRIVVGPTQRTPDIAASLALTRRAASALRAEVIEAPAAVVSCTDIAEQLLGTVDPALTAVLIEKYLHGLARLKSERRVVLARVLLDWLVHHYTYADLGAHLQVPRQTVHDQLKAAKTLVGEAADDPQARAALIVALQTAIDQWERDV